MKIDRELLMQRRDKILGNNNKYGLDVTKPEATALAAYFLKDEQIKQALGVPEVDENKLRKLWGELDQIIESGQYKKATLKTTARAREIINRKEPI